MATLTIEQFTDRVKSAVGGRLVSFVVFGAAARRGATDSIDTLVICDRVDPGLLGTLAAAAHGWVPRHPAPLVFGLAEWKDSADAFAVELSDLKAHHRVAAGRDPWDGLSVSNDDLRRQLEHELRGKVLRLRQAVVANARDPKALGQALAASVSGFHALLRGLLRLSGREAPADRTALIAAAAGLVGFDPGPVTELAVAAREHRVPKLGPGDPHTAAYLAAVTRTAEYVNGLPTRSEGR